MAGAGEVAASARASAAALEKRCKELEEEVATKGKQLKKLFIKFQDLKKQQGPFQGGGTNAFGGVSLWKYSDNGRKEYEIMLRAVVADGLVHPLERSLMASMAEKHRIKPDEHARCDALPHERRAAVVHGREGNGAVIPTSSAPPDSSPRVCLCLNKQQLSKTFSILSSLNHQFFCKK